MWSHRNKLDPSARFQIARGGQQLKRAALAGRPLQSKHGSGCSIQVEGACSWVPHAHVAGDGAAVPDGGGQPRVNSLGGGCVRTAARTCEAEHPGAMATPLKNHACNGEQ